ncbi:MAG: hypothetical protein QXH17_08685 [Candidatus Bathyarchaeia archaeon]
MFRRYLFLFVFLSSPLFFIHRTHADEGLIWGPVNLEIGSSSFHRSIQRIMVSDPGEGVLIVKKGDQGNSYKGGHIVFNGIVISLDSFFRGTEREFEREVKVFHDNRMILSFRGRVGSFVTVEIRRKEPFSVKIISPVNGENVYGPDVIVEGEVRGRADGNVGVVVNGVCGYVYGGRFFVEGVPLIEGKNTLRALATSTDGKKAIAQVDVNAITDVDYIRIRADRESGLSPFETTLSIEGSFSFTESFLVPDGPGPVEVLDSTPSEYRVRMTVDGVYGFSVEVRDPQGKVYRDRALVLVLGRDAVDMLLRSRWEGMKEALLSRNIPRAIGYFSEETRVLYGEIFSALSQRLPDIVRNMEDIELIYVRGNVAKYRIRKEEVYGGQSYPITYYIYFVVDRDGLWKIYRY